MESADPGKLSEIRGRDDLGSGGDQHLARPSEERSRRIDPGSSRRQRFPGSSEAMSGSADHGSFRRAPVCRGRETIRGRAHHGRRRRLRFPSRSEESGRGSDRSDGRRDHGRGSLQAMNRSADDVGFRGVVCGISGNGGGKRGGDVGGTSPGSPLRSGPGLHAAGPSGVCPEGTRRDQGMSGGGVVFGSTGSRGGGSGAAVGAAAGFAGFAVSPMALRGRPRNGFRPKSVSFSARIP